MSSSVRGSTSGVSDGDVATPGTLRNTERFACCWRVGGVASDQHFLARENAFRLRPNWPIAGSVPIARKPGDAAARFLSRVR